jgi:hypothetical protein
MQKRRLGRSRFPRSVSAAPRSTSLASSESDYMPPPEVGWDLAFESGSLHRRVGCEPDFLDHSWPRRAECSKIHCRVSSPSKGEGRDPLFYAGKRAEMHVYA